MAAEKKRKKTKKKLVPKVDVKVWSSHTPWADLNVRGDRWW